MPLTGSCFNTIKNAGSSQCTEMLDVTTKVWFQSIKQTDGITNNEINLSLPINKALLDGIMNNKDPFIRIFPTPFLNKLEMPNVDPDTEEDSYKVKYFLQDGVVRVTLEFWESRASAALYRSLESMRRIKDLGIYLLDAKLNIGYSRSNSGKARPIRIVPGSISVSPQGKSQSNTRKLIVSFDIHSSENYGKMGVIPASQIASDVVITDYEGLIDIYPKFTSITQTGCTLELYSLEGSEANPERLSGLVLNDFISPQTSTVARAYRENNTPGDLILATAVEGAGSNKGVYTITWASQVIGSILRFDFLKAGFDSANVRAATITI